MDREIAPEVRQRRRVRRVATIVVAVAAAIFFLATTVNWLKPSVRRREIVTARVARGTVHATLQAAGSVVPAIETVISSPVEARVLRIDHRAGDRLRAGDSILTLDTSASRLDVRRLDDAVAQKESHLAEVRLRVEESMANAAAALAQQKLDADILRFKAEQNDRLHKSGLASGQDKLAADTAVKKADIQLQQLADALTRARRSGDAQIAAAATELRAARQEREESRRQLDLAMALSDRDGVLTWVVPEIGATLRRGDILARVADLSSFRVVASISDVHASKLAAGMPAHVKIDDATTVDGIIATIDPRIENGAVRFWIDLEAASNPRLRNNLRVDVYAVTGVRNNVLQVRRGSIGDAERDGVFVVRGDTAVRVPVRFGISGEDNVEIVEGLREGDEVVVSNMTDYAGVKELRLK
ncbi:MAG: HlyD family efflux transporter periplasmic adaptor subunit [Acidobacteriota bacterium]